MLEWEYKVESIGAYDHPWAEFQAQSPAAGIQKLLEDWGKEGWELMHVHEIEGKWRSSPEMYPGGDPGRQTWDNGMTIMYFKRPGNGLAAK